MNETINSDGLRTIPTGELANLPIVIKKTLEFDPYEVVIAVTSDGKFIDIMSISLKTRFLSTPDWILKTKEHDVSNYYNEE